MQRVSKCREAIYHASYKYIKLARVKKKRREREEKKKKKKKKKKKEKKYKDMCDCQLTDTCERERA